MGYPGESCVASFGMDRAGEVAMSTGLDRVIAATLAGAGEGIARLRDTGADIVIRACSIEVVVDEAETPSAHVRVELGYPEGERPG